MLLLSEYLSEAGAMRLRWLLASGCWTLGFRRSSSTVLGLGLHFVTGLVDSEFTDVSEPRKQLLSGEGEQEFWARAMSSGLIRL